VGKQATVDIVRFEVPDVIDAEDTELVGNQLNALLNASESPRLLLDMENLEHVSSVMLSALVEARQLSEERGGRVALAQLHPRLKDLFETVRIDILFEIYLSVEAGVAALLD